MENTLGLELIEFDQRLTETAYQKLVDGELNRDGFIQVAARLRLWSEIGYGIVGILEPITHNAQTEREV